MKLLPPQLSGSSQSKPVHLGLEQQRVVSAVVAGTPVVSVVGAPGSGKTTLAVELVAHVVEAGTRPERVMLLSATRRGAGELRNAVTARLSGPVQGATVRTPAALAFSILTAAAAARREPLPRLITGPEQDHLLAQLLDGYQIGYLQAPAWPASIPEETLGLRGFRGELRDLLMRAAENGLKPEKLKQLGLSFERPEWVAAADVLRDYQMLTQFSTMTADAGRRYDPAQIVDDGAAQLANWEWDNPPRWDVVIVDDYQETTAATARLLTVLRKNGARLVLIGDPDVAVQGFRGARPSFVGLASSGDAHNVDYSQEQLGQFGAQQFVLDSVFRGVNLGTTQGKHDLRAVVQGVTQAIASVGIAAHRGAEVAEDSDAEAPVDASKEHQTQNACASIQILESPALESAYIAKLLRAAHLRDGIAWSDMAVIARSGAQLLALRRSLSQNSVPVAIVGTDIPLRDEPAVRPLLNAMKALGTTVEIDEALGLLTSVIGGVDAIGLRRLRRALRSEELRGGGGRTSDDLIVDALNNPDWASSLGAVGQPLSRVARVLQKGREAVSQAGATPQTVLWAIWDACGLADPWQRMALSGSAAAARADRDLDAVMSLFRAAETYVDRLPESSSEEFVAFIESQDIPADSLTQQVALGGKVNLVTPPAAAGREWPLVVVAGVQEGQWPDLRLRDSLLGSATLVEVISGRTESARGLGPQARKEVFYDELRAFALAVSRATNKLVVTAVRDDELEPSVFINLVATSLGNGLEEIVETNKAKISDIPLDLRGLTALTRAELVGALEDGDAQVAESRAALLKLLSNNSVTAADPSTWYGALELSSVLPLYHDKDLVPLSPSRVESVQRCSLRWSLEAAGGTPSAGLHQSVGTLIHEIAALHPFGRFTELVGELDKRWSQLRLPEGWPSRRQYDVARRMLEKLSDYYRLVEANGISQVLVEQPFTVEVEGARISGIVDRVEVTPGGAIRIADLKTGKQPQSKAEAEANPQLGIYQLATLNGSFENTNISDGASLVYVAAQTKTVSIRTQTAISDPQDNWAKDLVHETVEVMRSNTFTAQPNSMCITCPARRACPIMNEGQHVVPMSVTRTKESSAPAREETQA